MKLRTQPVITRGDDNLRDIYSDASDIPVATRVHHVMADEIVRRWNQWGKFDTAYKAWCVDKNISDADFGRTVINIIGIR